MSSEKLCFACFLERPAGRKKAEKIKEKSQIPEQADSVLHS